MTAALLSGALVVPSTVAHAQAADSACMVYLHAADLVDPAADIARIINVQDTGSHESFVLRRTGREFRGNACTAPRSVASLARRLSSRAPAAGIRPVPPRLLVVGNSAYPRDWNDGALWAGRGLGTSLTAGARARWGLLSAAVVPVVTWQSNAAFDIRTRTDTAVSEFASAWTSAIDEPQRFGDASFSRIDAGQSFVRVDYRGFGAGISNENIVWGPARRNPLLLSGTSAGFAHAFIETGRPVDVWLGDLELQLFWGRLTESEYFDHDPDNDHRLLAGMLFALQPRGLDGLTVGGGRLQTLTWWPELSLSDVVLGPYRGVGDNPGGRSGDNQLIAAFFRWANSPDGIEVYGEWAREDHWAGWTGLLRNLDASHAWTIGLLKVIRFDDDALQLSAEVSHLADALPINFAARGGGVGFYTHSTVRQGHTHRGQLLGAPIGTGAESQFAGADFFWRAGRTSLSIERARYEDDAYNTRFAPYFGAHARDTEVSVRAGHLATFGSLSIDVLGGWSFRYNRDLLGLDEIRQTGAGEYRRDVNWSMRLGARWTPQDRNR